jgi:hypothetical protein
MLTWCRKAAIQTFVLLGFLLPCCTSSDVSSAERVPTEPISSYEYLVYSDLFNALPIRSVDGKDHPLLVIGTETVGPTMDEVRRAAACQQDFIPGEPPPPRSSYLLSSEFRPLVDDLLIKNRQVYTLSRRFNLRRPYLLLRNSDVFAEGYVVGLDRLYKQYPRADGFKVLSRGGFNSQKTMALVYVASYYTPIDAFDTFVLMRKSDHGWIRVEAYTCNAGRAGIKPEVP